MQIERERRALTREELARGEGLGHDLCGWQQVHRGQPTSTVHITEEEEEEEHESVKDKCEQSHID
jgi:hypothetical protein